MQIEKKTRILIVFRCFHGGAGRVVSHLLHFWSDKYELAVLATKRDCDFSYPENVDYFLFECMQKEAGESYLKYTTRSVKGIKKIIRQYQPDIVISFLSLVNVFVCISLLGSSIPLLISERSNPLQEKHGWKFSLLRFVTYMKANMIVLQSQAFVDLYKGFFKKKTAVIPNPVMPVDHHLDLQDEIKAPKIIAVGNLSPWKNHDRMIRNFAKLHQNHPDATLTIYGEGSCRNALTKLIEDLHLENHVFLPGHISDVEKLLTEADIFWMTSVREGFPNSLCEAMAAGLPCVMYECHRGLRDIIENGVNGFLVPYEDDDEFIAKTELLCADAELRRKIENNAIGLPEKFSAEKICNMWEKLIAQHIRKKSDA